MNRDIVGAGLVAAFAALSIFASEPPAAQPRTAAATTFSAERAFDHVRELARRPAPVGSAGHTARRAYIEQELRRLRLQPELQRTEAAVAVLGKVVGGRVHNLLARLPGTASSKALMLSAHYDTVAQSPGASDDAAGVATLLEVARALTARGRLRHDLILLFTDGEEDGLLGANAFVAEHRWVRDVSAVLNFEARGSRGASAMYDTSLPNGALVRAFARGAVRPHTSSLVATLSTLLPNDSDLTVFKRAGLAGYGFAFADGYADYHRPTDTAQRLDRRSLQHHGLNALETVLALDAGGAEGTPALVYFDLFARWVVRYPVLLARVSGVLVALTFVLVAMRVAAGRARFGRVLLIGAACALLPCAGLACGIGVQTVLSSALSMPLAGHAVGLFVLAHSVLALLAALLMIRFLLRFASELELQLGALGALSAASLALALAAPGASPVTCLSTAFALGTLRAPRSLATWLYLIPAAILIAGLWQMLYVLVGSQLPAVPALTVSWASLLIAPWNARLWRPRFTTLARGLGLFGLAAASVGMFVQHGQRTVPSSRAYGLDADTGLEQEFATQPEAHAPDPARARAFWPVPAELSWRPGTARLTVPPPEMKLVRDERAGRERRIAISLRSVRAARCVRAWETDGVRIHDTRLRGKAILPWVRFGADVDRALWTFVTAERLYAGWSIELCGFAAEPIGVGLSFANGARPRFRIADISDGMPAGAAARWGDVTIVSRGFAPEE